MAEHDHHDHGHRHGLGSCCPPRQPAPPARAAGNAEKSLSDALRFSFRILTVLMVLILLAFLLRGFEAIDTTQRGVLTRFGRIEHITDKPGFVYTWPFPVGAIEKVSIKEKSLTVDDFWMSETPQDKTTPIGLRKAQSDGLIPGSDGALLTADRYLLHAKLICKYHVADVRAWKLNVAEEEELLRSAVGAAAVRAAASRTADNLQRFQKDEFLNEVIVLAQETLSKVGSGLRIQTVQLAENGMSWPLKALPAFDQVTIARSGMEKAINEAEGDATKILNDAAGEAYRVLVGLPGAGVTTSPAAGNENAPVGGLLGEYARAVHAGDNVRAAQMLEQIDSVLTTSATGDVSRIIAEARAYSTEIRQRIEGYALRFAKLQAQMPAEEQARRLMIERLWADTVDQVLRSPMIEKYYVSPGQGRFILRIARDSDIYREIQRLHVQTENQAPNSN